MAVGEFANLKDQPKESTTNSKQTMTAHNTKE